MISAQGLAPLSLKMTTKKFETTFHVAAILCICALWIGCVPVEARCYTTYEQALEDLDESRYEKAEEKLKKVLAEEPDNAGAHADMGRLYMNTENFPAMRAELNRAIELDSKLCRAYAYRSYLNFRTGHRKEAFADSQKAIELYTVNAHDWSIWIVLKNRARAYDMIGDRAKANADREKVQAFETLDQAGKFREVGRLPDALKRLDEALTKDPMNADMWFFRGVINANLMKFWDAVADYNRALQCAPKQTMLYYFRGDCYEQLEKYQQAVDDYTRVIKAGEPIVAYRFVCETGRLRNEILRDDTSCVSLNDVYFLRAQAYSALGKPQAALKDLDHIIASDKTDDKAMTRRAEIIESLGKSDESIKDFTRAINSNKDQWKTYLDRAEAYLRVGKDEEAIKDFTEVIRLTPNEPGSYVLRAGAYKSIGRYDEAIADYTTAIEIKPVDDLLLERSDCLRAVRKYDLALKDLDRAVEMYKGNSVLARALRAKILQENGQDQNARVELLELEKIRQSELHKNDTLNMAIVAGLVVLALGLGWIGFRFWRKRRK